MKRFPASAPDPASTDGTAAVIQPGSTQARCPRSPLWTGGRSTESLTTVVRATHTRPSRVPRALCIARSEQVSGSARAEASLPRRRPGRAGKGRAASSGRVVASSCVMTAPLGPCRRISEEGTVTLIRRRSGEPQGGRERIRKCHRPLLPSTPPLRRRTRGADRAAGPARGRRSPGSRIGAVRRRWSGDHRRGQRDRPALGRLHAGVCRTCQGEAADAAKGLDRPSCRGDRMGPGCRRPARHAPSGPRSAGTCATTATPRRHPVLGVGSRRLRIRTRGKRTPVALSHRVGPLPLSSSKADLCGVAWPHPCRDGSLAVLAGAVRSLGLPDKDRPPLARAAPAAESSTGHCAPSPSAGDIASRAARSKHRTGRTPLNSAIPGPDSPVSCAIAGTAARGLSHAPDVPAARGELRDGEGILVVDVHRQRRR